MKPGRAGRVVRERELIEVLKRRPDLQAVLDMPWPEPPAVDSPLYTLGNVVPTPHIAGSVGSECRRIARYMVDELRRYVRGEPLKWAVTPELAARSSHRPQGASASSEARAANPQAEGTRRVAPTARGAGRVGSGLPVAPD